MAHNNDTIIAEKKRSLLPALKDLIQDLITIEQDVAELEFKDSKIAQKRIRIALAEHKSKIDDFKHNINE